MELWILNDKFESVHVLDTFTSCIWTDRYNEYGDFEIYMVYEKEFLKMFQENFNNYLWNSQSGHLMIIEQISVETGDDDKGSHIIVEGRSLESILDRRVIWGQKVLSGNFQNGIEELLNDCIINPTQQNRKIDNFIFKESVDSYITHLTIDSQYYGDNLYDVIQALCANEKIGFKITLNDKNQFVFELYRGVDRTYNQTGNPHVVFSPKFDNLISSSYLITDKSTKNVTFIAGQGDGVDRKTTSVDFGYSGLLRREMFTDANDLAQDTEERILSTNEYLAELRQRGNEDLIKYKSIQAFEGENEPNNMFRYGEDYFIGDLVQIEDGYGHEGIVYISEYIISQDESGISTYPTFQTYEMEGGNDE